MLEILLELQVYIIGFFISIILVVSVKNRYYCGEPNEWVLVIKDGELKSCGIGLQGIRGIGETVVKFPSTINKVKFTADQVTKEFQGIRVTGFLIWSIYREGDGPFKAYKMLDNISTSAEAANESVARMAESIVRHNVANLTIEDVITQRHQIRDAMRAGMMEVVKGWGMWIETLEITDVYVLSKSLFENMQTEYRQAMRKDAEKVKAQTNLEIKEKQIEVQTALSMEESESSTKRAVYAAKQKLLEEQEDEKLQMERLRIEKMKIEQRKQIIQYEAEVKRLELDEREKLVRAELEAEAARVDVEQKKLKIVEMQEASRIRMMDERMAVELKYLPLKQLETVCRVYERVKDVRVVNVGGSGQDGSDQLLSRVMASLRTTDQAITRSVAD